METDVVWCTAVKQNPQDVSQVRGEGMKTGKMDDYSEGELHQCVELKRSLVYPAEIEAEESE